MIDIEFNDPDNYEPPGAFVDSLAHPFDEDNKYVEKAVIKEHRFAFFYWMKWYKKLKDEGTIDKPPLLVSIDWHTDLTTSESEKKDLDGVEDYNQADMALFCWGKMNANNDGQIWAAAYMNIISDIVLLKRQHSIDGLDGEPFVDKEGNAHNIFEFNDVQEFEKFLINREDTNVFFDIDLDYFITSEGNFTDRDSWTMMKKKRIKKLINTNRSFVKWILKRLEGFTIATEPDYCGGILKSCKILTIIEEQLFTIDGKWRV